MKELSSKSDWWIKPRLFYFLLLIQCRESFEIAAAINHPPIECYSKLQDTLYDYNVFLTEEESLEHTYHQYITDKTWNERRLNKFDEILSDRNADWEAGKASNERHGSVAASSRAQQWLIGVIKSCGANIRYQPCRLHSALLAFYGFLMNILLMSM